MLTWIIVLITSIVCGLICGRTINRFMDSKIKQNSWEYQICGFLFGNIFICGCLISVGRIIGITIEKIFL
jgi:uncharacterized membrane-anchored protein YhcB (DUF1043 family)